MKDDFMLTEKEAAELYARACNLLSTEPLEPFLNADTVYESQVVLTPLVGKENILPYLSAKLETLAGSPEDRPFFELGWVYGSRPCVILCQGSKDNPVGLAISQVDGRWIKRIDLCLVPGPEEAERTGRFPGIVDNG